MNNSNKLLVTISCVLLLLAVEVKGQDDQVLEGQNVTFEESNTQPLSISCKVDNTDTEDNINFYHKGTLIAKDNARYDFERNGTVYYLTIKHPRIDDIGEYTCQTAQGRNTTLQIFAKPYLEIDRGSSKKSKTLVEGDPMTLSCSVQANPMPTSVTWNRENSSLPEDGRVTTMQFEGVENASLRIVDMKDSDKGTYFCTATNEIGTGEASILVRVKDRFAALWPFLGICAEVIILCIIIFVYERRRAKKLAEEEMKDEADMLTNSHGTNKAKDETVRQRK